MKSAWGTSASNERKGTKLVDIMSEQAISEEYPDLVVTPVGVTDAVLSQQEMDDLRLAQLLQEEEERGAENLDDRYLAEYLQQLEMAELASCARPSPPDSLAHAKITTKSAYDDIGDRDREAVQLQALVTSSRFGEAVRRDRETEHLSSAEKAYLARHDPLLGALSAAHALSELEGVGDLPGQGLLVPSSVAQPVKSFLHKQQSQEHSASAKKTSGSHSQK